LLFFSAGSANPATWVCNPWKDLQTPGVVEEIQGAGLHLAPGSAHQMQGSSNPDERV